MPDLTFSHTELRTLAMALRIAARQASHDGDNQSNPRIKETFTADARDYAALAAKIESARGKRSLPKK